MSYIPPFGVKVGLMQNFRAHKGCTFPPVVAVGLHVGPVHESLESSPNVRTVQNSSKGIDK